MGKWAVEYADDFVEEVEAYPKEVQWKIAALSLLLESFGPDLGRPKVDTLKGSKHSNMKELRFSVDQGVWRVAFAFDPKRKATLLNAGNKLGVSESRCYREMWAARGEKAARGKADGRALINGVYERARRAGSTRVYWHTHETNVTAQTLYDKVAERSGFIVFRQNT